MGPVLVRRDSGSVSDGIGQRLFQSAVAEQCIALNGILNAS
jgi:hypothetical protein